MKTKTKTIELTERLERDKDAIPCPECNGYADKVELTKTEIKNQKCGRPYPCCGRAFVCRVCKTRIIGNAEAPEMGID